MIATFNAALREIEAAVERAGLSQGIREQLLSTDDTVFLIESECHVLVIGRCHNVMRVIGALADDGNDCLIDVE
jgi:hypothetical protein